MIRAAGGQTIVLTLDALSDAQGEDGWEQDIVRAITMGLPASGLLAGVVHLWSLDLPDVEGIAPEMIDKAMTDSCQSAVRLLRLLEEAVPASTTPVWFVTRGSQPWALEPKKMAPLQAPLWGLARAAALELPSRWGGLVDLDPASPAADSPGSCGGGFGATPRAKTRSSFDRGQLMAGASYAGRRGPSGDRWSSGRMPATS